jgi:hypothetical protein
MPEIPGWSVPESEKEFRAAICLCSTPRCRGSFLYFAGSRAFQQVLNDHHTLLHRQALLLQANVDPLNADDKARMAVCAHSLVNRCAGSLLHQ